MICASDRVEIAECENVAIVTLLGDILDDAEDLRRVVETVIARGRPRLAFNMGGAKYVSARVLGIIADFIRRARETRGEVKLICSHKGLGRLLHLMGFHYAVEIVSSSDDAMGGFPEGIVTPEKMMLWKEPEVLARA